jgi:hypothetical protein
MRAALRNGGRARATIDAESCTNKCTLKGVFKKIADNFG